MMVKIVADDATTSIYVKQYPAGETWAGTFPSGYQALISVVLADYIIIEHCNLQRLLKKPQSTPSSPNLWGFFKAGGHPQTPGRKYPEYFFQRSLYTTQVID
jgi:hypothetical protein